MLRTIQSPIDGSEDSVDRKDHLFLISVNSNIPAPAVLIVFCRE